MEALDPTCAGGPSQAWERWGTSSMMIVMRIALCSCTCMHPCASLFSVLHVSILAVHRYQSSWRMHPSHSPSQISESMF